MTIEDLILEALETSYSEKLRALPPPPPNHYYAPSVREVRQDGENYVIDVELTLTPVIVPLENPTDPDGIRTAALALCNAVERYICPKPRDKTCLRSELLNTKDRLRELLKT